MIVVSARGQPLVLRAGAKAFLQKPVDNAERSAVIRRLRGEPATPKKDVVSGPATTVQVMHPFFQPIGHGGGEMGRVLCKSQFFCWDDSAE